MKTQNLNIRNVKNNLFVLSLMISSIFFLASCQKEDSITPSQDNTAASDRQIQSISNDDVVHSHPINVVGPVNVLNVHPAVIKPFTILKIDHRAAMSFRPDYSVSVSSDGKVEFEGRRNVFFIGKKELKISSGDIQVIKNLFNRMGFFSMSEDLPGYLDMPIVYTTYSEQGPAADAQKTLRDNNTGFPVQLVSLRIRTESILNISWLINGHDSSITLNAAAR